LKTEECGCLSKNSGYFHHLLSRLNFKDFIFSLVKRLTPLVSSSGLPSSFCSSSYLFSVNLWKRKTGQGILQSLLQLLGEFRVNAFILFHKFFCSHQGKVSVRTREYTPYLLRDFFPIIFSHTTLERLRWKYLSTACRSPS